MPTDRDLHNGFDRAASQVEPDVQRHLHQTLRHGRRRILVRRTVRVTTVVAAMALIVTAGPVALRELRGSRADAPGGTPSQTAPSSTDGSAIAGTYTIEVPDAPGVIREQGMAGSWTLRLEPDGTVLLTSPTSFAGSTTGIVFELTGDEFRTNAFVTDLCGNEPPGLYRWERAGTSLRFTTVADHVTLASRSSPRGPGRNCANGVSQTLDVGLWGR